MASLRFLLILFLTVALDLSAPLPPPIAEIGEESEEILHRGRDGRRVLRLVRDTVAPALAQDMRAGELARLRPRPLGPPPRAATVVRAVKAPPPVAEPASSPEDH